MINELEMFTVGDAIALDALLETRPRSAGMHSDRFPCDHMKVKAAPRELYKPQGCLPLWPEEEAEVYPSHSSAGDATAVCLQVTRGNAESS